MQVELYKGFIKRKNSTKQPTELTPVVKDVKLKGECSVLNPSFFLADADSYTYLKAWGNYYFIDRVAYDINGAQYINCSIDVLASYKAAIQATSAFVMYSTSDYNRWIRDDRCPIIIKGSEIVQGSSAIITPTEELVFEEDALNETVILTAIAGEMGLMHYVIDEETLNDIAASLCHNDIQSLLENMVQQFGDAVGSIVQIRRIPVRKECLATVTLGTIFLGNYEVPSISSGNPIDATYLASTMVAAHGSVGVPVTYTDFRYTEPYCTARMSLPFIGIVDISISDFPDGSIYWKMLLDVVSGTIIFGLYNSDSDSKPVATYSGECGMLIPIASSQIANAGSIVTSASTGLASITLGLASENPVALGGGIMSVAKAFVATAQKTNTIIGAYSGNRSEFLNRRVRIMVEKYATANEPSNLTDLEGRPLMQVRQIEGLTGYVQTVGFSIAVEAIAEVRDLINSAMDRGVYIE